MDERRSLIEWIFDSFAAIGIVVAVVSILFRDRYPTFDVVALAYAAGGLAVAVGGGAASNWCKQKRRSKLIKGTEANDRDAN